MLGGVIRYATAAIITAVCLVLGFSPPAFLASHIGDLARFIEGPIPRFLLVAFGIAIWLVLYLHDRKPMGRKIPLMDAARIAYEKSEGTPIGETADTIIGPSIEDRLQYFVHAFLIDPVPLYGKKPPSTISRQIPIGEMKRLEWIPSTNTICYLGNNKMFWEDIFVYRRDLKKYIRKLKLLNKQLAMEATLAKSMHCPAAMAPKPSIGSKLLTPLDQSLSAKISISGWILNFSPTMPSPRLLRKYHSIQTEQSVKEEIEMNLIGKSAMDCLRFIKKTVFSKINFDTMKPQINLSVRMTLLQKALRTK